MKKICMLIVGTLLLSSGCGKSKFQLEKEAESAEKTRLEVRKKIDDEEQQFQEKLKAIAASKQNMPAKTVSSGQIENPALNPLNTELIKKLQEKLILRMKDPSSAQFRNVKLNFHGDALCGEVNARNGFGGYNGFKHFVVTQDGAYVESDKKDDLEGLLYQGTASQQGCTE